MVSRYRMDAIMGQDRTRTRFIDATGGLNVNTQPWKIADNEYAAANNMLLDGDDLVSRAGSTITANANIHDELHKTIAEYTFYNKLGVLTMCVVTATAGSTGDTTFHVYERTSGSATFTSVGTITTTSPGVVVTGTHKRDMLNFKNRMIISDGENRPLEYNRNYSNTALTLLGIDGPNRKKYFCDFDATPANDPIAFQAYTYATSSEDGVASTLNAYIANLVSIAKSTNNYCRLVSGSTSSGGTKDTCIKFTTAANFKLFADGTVSDDNDYISFTAYFDNMLSMDYLAVDIDTHDGTFTDGHGYWRRIELTQAILNSNDWGGAPGNNNGRYFIKLKKLAFLDSTDAEPTLDWLTETDYFDFATVKAFRFVLKTVDRPVADDSVPKVYIDLLSLEESPPIVSPSEKVLRSFDPYEAWSVVAPSGIITGYDYSKKTQGFSSLKVTLPTFGGAVLWGVIESDTGTEKDFGHWAGDEAIKQSDFISIDIYNDSDMPAGIWLTIRFINEDEDEHVGITKIINLLQPEGAKLPIVGILKPQTWTTIWMPVKFLMQTFWLKRRESIGQFESANHDATGFDSTKDTDAVVSIDETSATDSEILDAEGVAWSKLVTIMSHVDKVQIGIKSLVLATTKFRFDNLRLCRQHLEKGICSFNSVDVYRLLDIPGLAEKTESKYPVLSTTITIVDKLFGQILTEALMVGEVWQVDGVQNDDVFDYQIKTSLLSCLKMEIKGGDTATATISFSPTLNLTNFGLDLDATDPGYKWARFKKLIGSDTYTYADGFDSDENDYITFDIMCSNISAIDFAYIIFQPTSDDNGDYYAYDVAATDLTSIVGLSKARNNKWMSLQIHKSDFVRYGSTAGINWGDIASMVLIVGTKGSDNVTVRIDNMNLKACGALKGNYYYKVVYRSDESISRASDASLVLPASQVDAYLDSIPVSTDGRVLYKDIYRMGGDSSQYRLVDSIGNSVTTYVDKKLDSRLGPVLDDNNYEPPVASCMWEHRNRLWTGNEKLHTSRVRWSRSFVPSSFPIANYMDINPNIYGTVVGGISRGDDQIVFKTRAISKIVESGDNYWDVLLDASTGCSAEGSICSENGIVYWIFDKKAYRMDGDRVDRVFGHKVQPLFAYADSTAKAICANGRILFAVKSTNSSTINDVIISYNTVYGKWESVLVGSGWGVADMFCSVIDGKIFGARSAYLSIGTTPTGVISELFSGLTDNGAAIAAMITPKYIPGYEKRVEGFEVFMTSIKTGAESAACLTMQPIIDYLTTNTVADTFELDSSVSPQIKSIKIRGEDVTNFLGVKFSCATTTGIWRYLMSVFEYIVETDM